MVKITINFQHENTSQSSWTYVFVCSQARGDGNNDLFNCLSPNIHLQILQSDLHTFP